MLKSKCNLFTFGVALMKKFLISILSILTIVSWIGLTACSKPTTNHIHAFSSDFYYNNEEHYNFCTCGKKTNVSKHSFNTGITTKQPTTTEFGEIKFTCKTCDYVKTEILEKIEMPAESEQPSIISVDLTKDNFENYLDVQFLQGQQTSKLVNALYRIKYPGGQEIETWGLNPNLSNAISCVCIKTKYEITTKMNIAITPKYSDVRFSGVLLLLNYKTAFGNVQVNNYGYGTYSFTITETMYNINGYKYTIKPNDAFASVIGGAYYYE